MRALILGLLFVSVGCVTSGTHNQLKDDYAKLLLDLNKTQEAVRSEEARTQELAEKLSRLDAELGATLQQKSSLESNIEQVRKDKTSLEASVSQMQLALAELRKRKAEADARIAEFKSLLGKFRTLIDAGKLKVRMSEGRMVVELATDVLFPSGSASLSRDGKVAIAEVSQLLASIPERKFQIEGHTDNVPIRTKQYRSNWDLAADRALTVVKTMVDVGMPTERISAASFGDSKPARPNDSPENKASNRRIEIVVVPDLSSLPGFEELQRVSAE